MGQQWRSTIFSKTVAPLLLRRKRLFLFFYAIFKSSHIIISKDAWRLNIYKHTIGIIFLSFFPAWFYATCIIIAMIFDRLTNAVGTLLKLLYLFHNFTYEDMIIKLRGAEQIILRFCLFFINFFNWTFIFKNKKKIFINLN